MCDRYLSAKEIYANYGVDTDAVIAKLTTVPVSLHCWQGDDITGFDREIDLNAPSSNYMGKAKTPEELMSDIEKVMQICPGAKKLNLHACYAIMEKGEYVDRDKIEPKHFAKWVAFAKKHNLGIDFNPTCFGHDKVKDGFTLASADEETRKFWVRHCKACIKIAEYFATETGMTCIMNIWTGDGVNDVPSDRYSPRLRYKQSLEEIISEPFDKTKVKICVEPKLYGNGAESYMAGSAEFALAFAAKNEGCLPLMDNGHYHPTEMVSDKISSMLTFFPEIALHVTRPIRCDSKYATLFDDETKEMAKEIVRCDALDRVYMALDYFDASINRIASWAVGLRSWQKALLYAMLEPNAKLKDLQKNAKFTQLMIEQELLKVLPFGDIWNKYCEVCGCPTDDELFDCINEYEREVLAKRV